MGRARLRRRDLDRDLLPAGLSGPDAPPRERPLLPQRGRGRGRRLPRLPAVPPGGEPGLAGLGRPRRPRRAGAPPHRGRDRRRGGGRRPRPRLAVSSRHLQRQLVGELGVGRARARPHAAGRAWPSSSSTRPTSRARTSRSRAGFRSLRAYNEAMRRSFGRSPTEIRAHRPIEARPGASSASGSAIDRRSRRTPCSPSSPRRAIPGVEVVAGLEYRRAVHAGSGDAILRLRPAPTAIGGAAGPGPTNGPDAATCPRWSSRSSPSEPGELAGLVRAARRLLDLDADPAAIDAALAADDVLRPLVVAGPGTRLPGAFDGFATTVLAILAQGVTLASARTMAGRIAACVRPRGRRRRPGDRAPVPGAGRPGRAPISRRPGSRVAARRRSGPWHGRSPTGGSSSIPSPIRSRRSRPFGRSPGSGPGRRATSRCGSCATRTAFPPDDAAVRAAFRRLGLPSDPASIAARAEAWRPWRGYALAHLWAGA